MPKNLTLNRPLNHERRRALVVEALRQAKGNRERAAQLLGVHRTTLYRLMLQFGLLQ